MAFLVAGATLGRFSGSQGSGSNTFTAGTVTLTNSPTTACAISGVLPDGTAHACPPFTATYGGSAPAYLAVDVLIETQHATGGTNLYNPGDGMNDLQVTVTSTNPSVTYSAPMTSANCPGGAPANSTCYELDNELVATSSLSSASVTFTVSAKLPTTAVVGTQGGAAQIILTTHAVQATHNTISCSSGPTAGAPCTPSGSFHWS